MALNKKSKPYAPSCDKNKEDILKVLKKIISEKNIRLLEVGSGTGQHAVHFAPHFKNLQWVTSDVAYKLDGIKMWLKESQISNIHGPLEFQVGKDDFPRQKFDVLFAANIFHIMPWKDDKTLIKMLGTRLREGAKVIFYGAFNYNGKFLSESNEEFDKELKAENSKRGLRNFEDIYKAMTKAGFELTKEFEMPNNNRILYFTRLPFVSLFE